MYGRTLFSAKDLSLSTISTKILFGPGMHTAGQVDEGYPNPSLQMSALEWNKYARLCSGGSERWTLKSLGPTGQLQGYGIFVIYE